MSVFNILFLLVFFMKIACSGLVLVFVLWVREAQGNTTHPILPPKPSGDFQCVQEGALKGFEIYASIGFGGSWTKERYSPVSNGSIFQHIDVDFGSGNRASRLEAALALGYRFQMSPRFISSIELFASYKPNRIAKYNSVEVTDSVNGIQTVSTSNITADNSGAAVGNSGGGSVGNINSSTKTYSLTWDPLGPPPQTVSVTPGASSDTYATQGQNVATTTTVTTAPQTCSVIVGNQQYFSGLTFPVITTVTTNTTYTNGNSSITTSVNSHTNTMTTTTTQHLLGQSSFKSRGQMGLLFRPTWEVFKDFGVSAILGPAIKRVDWSASIREANSGSVYPGSTASGSEYLLGFLVGTGAEILLPALGRARIRVDYTYGLYENLPSKKIGSLYTQTMTDMNEHRAMVSFVFPFCSVRGNRERPHQQTVRFQTLKANQPFDQKELS